MAIALVNEEARNAWSSGSTYTITESPAVQDGSLCIVPHNCGAQQVIGIAQNSGTPTNWTIDVSGTAGRNLAIVSAPDCASYGDTSTVTLAGNPPNDGNINAAFAEFSGLSTTPFHSGSHNNGTSSAPTTGTVTPPDGVETLIIVTVRATNIITSPGAPWTAFSNGQNTLWQAYWRVVTGDGSTTYSASWVADNAAWAADIACYVAPTGSSVTITPTGFGLAVSQGTMDVRADTTIYQIPGYGLTVSLGTPVIVAGGSVQVNASGFGLGVSLGTPVVAIDSIVVSPTGFGLFALQGTPTIENTGVAYKPLMVTLPIYTMVPA